VHGVYDFFLLNSEQSRTILLSLALMLVMVREFHRYLQNALNHSPAAAALAEPQSVNLFAWLAGIALALLALIYLYNYQSMATEIANTRLTSLSLSALPPALVVLAALGRLRLQPGYIKPWGLRRNQAYQGGKMRENFAWIKQKKTGFKIDRQQAIPLACVPERDAEAVSIQNRALL
jgi:hypothetical protein